MNRQQLAAMWMKRQGTYSYGLEQYPPIVGTKGQQRSLRNRLDKLESRRPGIIDRLREANAMYIVAPYGRTSATVFGDDIPPLYDKGVHTAGGPRSMLNRIIVVRDPKDFSTLAHESAHALTPYSELKKKHVVQLPKWFRINSLRKGIDPDYMGRAVEVQARKFERRVTGKEPMERWYGHPKEVPIKLLK